MYFCVLVAVCDENTKKMYSNLQQYCSLSQKSGRRPIICLTDGMKNGSQVLKSKYILSSLLSLNTRMQQELYILNSSIYLPV